MIGYQVPKQDGLTWLSRTELIKSMTLKGHKILYLLQKSRKFRTKLEFYNVNEWKCDKL